jgi:hypothetical protein
MAALLVLSRLFSSSSLPPVLSEAQGFFASRGLQLRCEYVASAGSRTTSRIAVRSGPKGGALIGMFRPGTHEVVPCLSEILGTARSQVLSLLDLLLPPL